MCIRDRCYTEALGIWHVANSTRGSEAGLNLSLIHISVRLFLLQNDINVPSPHVAAASYAMMWTENIDNKENNGKRCVSKSITTVTITV